MKTAEQWTALYEDGGSALNDPTRHITDIIREIQREAFDAGAYAALRDVAAQGCFDFVLPHPKGLPERP